MVTLSDFQNDLQGRRYAHVVNDPRLPFQLVIDFFNDPARMVRLVDSELHHDRPALAGVVVEFERVPAIDGFFMGYDGHTTRAFRQAVGVLVRMHMERLGWRKTGRKGSLGSRLQVKPGTTTPGAYRNGSGISRWFTKAERYEPASS